MSGSAYSVVLVPPPPRPGRLTQRLEKPPHSAEQHAGRVQLGPQQARAETRRFERILNELPDAAVRKLLAGQVDPRDEWVRQKTLAAPLRGLPARLAQDELSERHDQPGGFSDGDEAHGRNLTASR